MLVYFRVAHIKQLLYFAFGNCVGGVCQYFHDAHGIKFDHHLKAARIQKISNQYAGGIAPHGMRTLLATAQVRLVHHIIMQ